MGSEPKSDPGDTSFMALSAALVLLMTPGLAFYYGGMVREKNILNTMMMSLISMGLISAYWMALGFSISFSWSMDYVLYNGLTDMIWPATKITGLLFATFQMTFAIITVALISGALVERMRFGPYMIFITIWFFAVYVPLCYWVWGGGWIFQIGAKDFAGGTVVHISSGTSAYVGAALLGKRKFMDGAGAHNVPFVVLGGAILWFGWTGFNGGSALASNWLATLAVTTTFLAAACGMTTWVLLEMMTDGKPSAIGAMTGAVAGLVGITPIAGYVTPVGSLAVGVVTAIVCTAAVKLAARLRVVDDSLDCFTVHGVGGYTGALLGGLLDTSGGILYGHGPKLMSAQIIGASAGMAFSAVATAIIFIVLQAVMKVRVDESLEAEGMDLSSHSEVAYSLKSKEGDPMLAAQRSINEDIMRYMSSSMQQQRQRDPLMSLMCCAAQDAGPNAGVVQAYQSLQATSTSMFASAQTFEDPVIEGKEDDAVVCCCCWPREEEGGRNNPAAGASTYTAAVPVAPGQDVGITLDASDESRCLVAGITPGGAVAQWNSRCPASQVIKQGDCIMGLNGFGGRAAEIAARVASDAVIGQLMFLGKRGRTARVSIEKNGQSLGIGIAPDDSALGIQVQDVRPDGAIAAWNASHPFKVKPGDRIVSVSGQTSHSSILSQLQSSTGKLEIEVLSWL
eukprot:TRINITY_DN18448_c0_g2_i1.p1 TRINITY_DN18448_c0_g2~~TRINITY_DN18448_c0_g2_i1.p1  ORF type:complete len:680 (+),score=122.47 TRINITY_DN18448_c0_g2_i1:119-2158(+)